MYSAEPAAICHKRSCAATKLNPKQRCLCAQRRGVWFPPPLLNRFLLLVLLSTCFAVNDAWVDSSCNTPLCHPNCAAAVTPPERGWLPLQPKAGTRDVKSISLLQATVVFGQTHDDAEEEGDEETDEKHKNKQQPKEELIVAKGKEEKAKEVMNAPEEMGEEEDQQQTLEDGSWKARAARTSLSDQSIVSGGTAGGSAASHTMRVMSLASSHRQQPVRGRSLFGTAALKLNSTAGNHSGNKSSRGLHAASQLQMSSRSSVFNANLTIAFVLSSGRSWHYAWMGFQQLGASLHFRKMLALFAALFIVAVLVFVCFSGHKFNLSWLSRMQSRHDTMGVTRLCHNSWTGTTEHLGSGTQSAGYARFTGAIPNVEPTGSRHIFESLPSLPQTPERSQQSSYLCNLLVVPPGCECILHVPMNPKKCFDVLDQHGVPVIGVELKASKNGLQERRCIQLSTRQGATVAHCEAVPVPGRGDEIQLKRSTGEYFARFFPGGPTEEAQSYSGFGGPRTAWTVQTPSGSEWFFRGHFDSHLVEITDPMGRMLALSHLKEPTWSMRTYTHNDGYKFYTLRVAPLMDVSIVLCGLLAVQHLR